MGVGGLYFSWWKMITTLRLLWYLLVDGVWRGFLSKGRKSQIPGLKYKLRGDVMKLEVCAFCGRRFLKIKIGEGLNFFALGFLR